MAGNVSNELKKLIEQKSLLEIKLKESKDQIESLNVKNLDVNYYNHIITILITILISFSLQAN